MKTFEGIDYSFRPKSYWDVDGLLTALVANVKGAERKKVVLEMIRTGKVDWLDVEMMSESLSWKEREAIGRIHPILMGGEWLPDALPGEVEIARVTYDSTTQDVISVRARQEGRGIAYRIVDEYDSELSWTPKASTRPLTLRQLIRLMDSVDGWRYFDEDAPKGVTRTGLTEFFRDMNVDQGYDPDDALGCYVSSEFYPDVERHYDQEAEAWAERHGL